MRVDHDAHIQKRFSAIGAGDTAAVRLAGAQIGGYLVLNNATFINGSCPALDVAWSRAGAMIFTNFVAVGDGAAHTTLNLGGMAIDGRLVFLPRELEHNSNVERRINLDGLTYSGLPLGVNSSGWLDLIRFATPTYAAQPYQHLAAAHRSLGHEREMRETSIRQRRDQLDRRVLKGRLERAWARLTDITLGYGYQPWRALLLLCGLIAISVVATLLLAAHGALSQSVATATPVAAGSRQAMSCSAIDQVGFGLDLGTPLIKTGARTHCDTTSGLAGQVLTGIGWLSQILAWALASLFVAGFTGAVRKT